MPCFYPVKWMRSRTINEATGRYGITYNPAEALIEGLTFSRRCGQCSGCKMDDARDWSIRCVHEAMMHNGRCCFVTLTYSPEHVPQDYSVRKRPLQLFHMRNQEFFGPGKSYRSIGEYGDQDGRPHYHGLLFGIDFSEDRKRWSKRNGHQTWRSEKLEELWPFGHSEIGSVTPESAGYVSRYTMKKINGRRADDHYFRVSPIDGERHRVEPEFALSSRRPAIGRRWLEKFEADVESGFVVIGGRPQPVPRYYVRMLEELKAERMKRDRLRKEFADVAAWRRRRAEKSSARLAVREEVSMRRQALLVRDL